MVPLPMILLTAPCILWTNLWILWTSQWTHWPSSEQDHSRPDDNICPWPERWERGSGTWLVLERKEKNIKTHFALMHRPKEILRTERLYWSNRLAEGSFFLWVRDVLHLYFAHTSKFLASKTILIWAGCVGAIVFHDKPDKKMKKK